MWSLVGLIDSVLSTEWWQELKLQSRLMENLNQKLGVAKVQHLSLSIIDKVLVKDG